MAKSFLTAPTAAIVHTQQVVATSVAPSDLERAKACCKQSTTHGPSCKEVMVITSLPTHCPEKLVVGLLNSYLGSHGRAIQAVTKTQNHLRGLALVCDVLPVEADIQVMHTYFDAAAKGIHEDDTTETWVEVGLSKPFLCIPQLPILWCQVGLPHQRQAHSCLSLHSRLRRSSLPPNGKTPSTCTKGLCPDWSETLASWTPAWCPSIFMVPEVVNTSAALRAIALCLATLPSPSSVLKSGLESPSAQGAGGMATVLQCAPSKPSCALSVLDLTSLNATMSLECAVRHNPRQNLLRRQPLLVTPVPIPHGVSTVVLTTAPTAVPALSGSTEMTPSGCIPSTLHRR
jgi:hypothetical protein